MDSPPIPFRATTTFAYYGESSKKKKRKADASRVPAKSTQKVVPIPIEEKEPFLQVESDPHPAPPTPTPAAAPNDPDSPAKSTCSSIQSHLRVNPDKLLDSYGKYGRMQLLGHFLCQYLNLLYSASLFVVTYISNKPETTCLSRNGTLITDACGRQGECVEGTFNSTDTKPVGSIFMWYNITCGNEFLIEAGSTSYVLGAMLVVPIFCRLADRYGRKPLLLISLYLSLFFNCIIPLSPWYPLYIVLRFLLGATSDAYLSISALLTVEFICQDARPIITLLSTTGFALGLLWIGFLSLFITDWQWLYGATIAPGFLTVIYLYCLTESPYWLASHDQTHDLKEYCKKANKMNGVNVNYRECIEEKGKPPEHHVRFRDLLKHRDIVKGIAINGLTQFTLSTSYYSITFMSTRFTSSNPTIGFMLLAAAEIPGGVLAMVLMKYCGRRTLVVASFVLQGICLFVTPFLGSEVAVVIALSFLKVFNTICFAVHPIFVAESVPTSVRSLVASIVNIPQSAGMLLGPFFKYSTEWNSYVSFIALSIQSMVAGGILMLLKETKGKDLPEDLDDLNRDRSQYNRKKLPGTPIKE